MKRKLTQNLMAWKKSKDRKPLILQGVRQVGKTWLLKQFGAMAFENVAYFSFDEQPELKQFFQTTKNPERVLQHLTLLYGKPIFPKKTLIIFDEIQECNEALNSLKYFYENKPEYAIACAGSLLGVALSRGDSFPVGKVDFLHLYPFTFSEFLAVANPNIFNYLESIETVEPIPDIFFSQLIEWFKMYFISGGMPKAITALLEKQDIAATQKALRSVLNAYELDFSKHIANKDIPKIGYVWSSIPSQLARENKKFLYQSVKQGARAREYEDALWWLEKAGLVYRVFQNTKPCLPISAYDDLSAFKLYSLDVGLLRRLSNLDPIAIKEGNRLFVEFKGALSENFVLQSLVAQYEDVMPRYWKSGNQAEVDFLIQHKNQIIPCEVKSGESVRSKSLAVYEDTFHPTLRIRYSLQNLKFDGNLLNIPLFMADYSKKLIELTN